MTATIASATTPCANSGRSSTRPGTIASHYRTHAGAEVDLVLEHPDGGVQAIEIKRTLSPKLTPAFRESMATLGAARGTYVMPSGATFPLSDQVTATSLAAFLSSLT